MSPDGLHQVRHDWRRRSTFWAATASDIEGPTDLDWVGVCFETEISRGALDHCMAQERSNCLQIASTFQNVESLRPAFPGSPAMRTECAVTLFASADSITLRSTVRCSTIPGVFFCS